MPLRVLAERHVLDSPCRPCSRLTMQTVGSAGPFALLRKVLRTGRPGGTLAGVGRHDREAPKDNQTRRSGGWHGHAVRVTMLAPALFMPNRNGTIRHQPERFGTKRNETEPNGTKRNETEPFGTVWTDSQRRRTPASSWPPDSCGFAPALVTHMRPTSAPHAHIRAASQLLSLIRVASLFTFQTFSPDPLGRWRFYRRADEPFSAHKPARPFRIFRPVFIFLF